jgi:hypothetical protein
MDAGPLDGGFSLPDLADLAHGFHIGLPKDFKRCTLSTTGG